MATLLKLPQKLTQYARKINAVPRLVEITQIRSGEHSRQSVRECLDKLGLKMNKSVVHKNNSPIRGMIFRVRSNKMWIHWIVERLCFSEGLPYPREIVVYI